MLPHWFLYYVPNMISSALLYLYVCYASQYTQVVRGKQRHGRTH